MGRSSSSRKKKHSKSSSQARAKKKSKIRSQKSRSKKLRRYSTSSSDDYDDDSRSSMSGSYCTSSSEDAKSRRAKKSQVRSKKKHVLVKKRKDRKRSYSTESSDEEDSPRARKRSGSKRKRDYESKSKSRSKKKLRRDESFSPYESEDEFERQREKRGADERDVSGSEKVDEIPSCGEDGEEQVVVEYNPRRLRSIIVKEDSELIRDEEKEEVMFHDDYPSGKSNDSDETWNEKEERDDKITMLDNEKGDDEVDDETVASDFGIPNDEKSVNVSDGNEETSGDLEMVLRQRALENLRKFRGSSDKPNDKNGDDAKQSSKTQNAEVVVAAEAQLTSGSDRSSALMKQNIARPVNQAMNSGSSKENVAVGVSTARLKLVRPVFERHLSDISSTLKEEASGDQEPRTELQRSKSCLDEPTDTGIATTTIQKSDINGAGANNECVSVAPESSSLPSASAIDKPRDERSDGSQLEKKTMSIMRGGEMVQVKYQVYIPKKSPALERRKLKR